MKSKFLLLLLSVTSLSIAQEAEKPKEPHIVFEKPRVHFLSPKFIWRKHKENGYHYKTWAIGYEYNIKKAHGMNFKLSSLTSIGSTYRLVETNSSLHYKVGIAPHHNLYPIMESRTSTHRVDRVDFQDIYINKSTLSCGIGWEYGFYEGFTLNANAQAFRDLFNSLVVQESDNFWGKQYSNPTGYKTSLAVAYDYNNRLNGSLEGSFCKTFKNCYKEYGLAAAINWGF